MCESIVCKKSRDYIAVLSFLSVNSDLPLPMVKPGKKVDQYSSEGIFIKTHINYVSASKELSVSPSAISQAVRLGMRCKGFLWKLHYDKLPNEIWKDHPTYDIKCSNQGRIMYASGLVASPTISRKGYHIVCFRHGSITKSSVQVHRLVAEAFLKDQLNDLQKLYPNEKLQVDHLNMIKTDNCLSNLEWVTNSENMRRRYEFPRKNTDQ